MAPSSSRQGETGAVSSDTRSGSTGLNIWVFLFASILARGLRFFLVAALLWKFGAPIRDFIERRLGLMFSLAMALLVGGFYVVTFL